MGLLTINRELEALEKQAAAAGADIDAQALRRLDELALTATPRTKEEAQAQADYLTLMGFRSSLGPAGVEAFMRAARVLNA